MNAKLSCRKASIADLRTIITLLLTTNKQRLRAKKFYENLGFEATHEGMKLYLRAGA